MNASVCQAGEKTKNTRFARLPLFNIAHSKRLKSGDPLMQDIQVRLRARNKT
jgi:hypothetical protein